MSTDEYGPTPPLMNSCRRWWCDYESHLDAGAGTVLTRHHLTLGHVREATDDVVVTVELVGMDIEPPTLLLTRTPGTAEAAASLNAVECPADHPWRATSQWVGRFPPFEAIRLVAFLLDGIDRVIDEPSQPATFHARGTPFPRSPEMARALDRFPVAAAADGLLDSLRGAGVDLQLNDLDVAQLLAAHPLVLCTVAGWVNDIRP